MNLPDWFIFLIVNGEAIIYAALALMLLIALYYLWGKLFMSDDGYAYGHIGNLSIARQNKRTGEVERLRMDRIGGPIWIPAHGWEDTFAEDKSWKP